MRVYGPYVYRTGRNAGRRYMMIRNDDGTRRQLLYSRWLMEQKLGRQLDPSEHVDHVDEDPTNDDIKNLQLLTPGANARKSAALRRPTEYIDFKCPECRRPTRKLARLVRHNRKQGKAGPYCGKSCAVRASRKST